MKWSDRDKRCKQCRSRVCKDTKECKFKDERRDEMTNEPKVRAEVKEYVESDIIYWKVLVFSGHNLCPSWELTGMATEEQAELIASKINTPDPIGQLSFKQGYEKAISDTKKAIRELDIVGASRISNGMVSTEAVLSFLDKQAIDQLRNKGDR